MAEITIDATEFMGATKARYITFDITDYTQGGESLVPNDAGMHRFQFVTAQVADGTGYLAQYDETDGTVKLFGGTAGDGTGSGGSIEFQEADAGASVTVAVEAKGR